MDTIDMFIESVEKLLDDFDLCTSSDDYFWVLYENEDKIKELITQIKGEIK